jgi:uncharacterized membrane protein
MKNFRLILTLLFGAFMIFGGVNHFLKPEIYLPFFADFLPKTFLNYASGLLEIFVGVMVFTPKYRSWGTLGILCLMLVFLPLHFFDIFKEHPAIGDHQKALFRLPIQFLFIAWAWFIHKQNAVKTA